MQKTNKRVSKTFWKTGSGKLMRRKAGQAHFNARDTGKATKNKRRDQGVKKVDRKLSLVMGK